MEGNKRNGFGCWSGTTQRRRMPQEGEQPAIIGEDESRKYSERSSLPKLAVVHLETTEQSERNNNIGHSTVRKCIWH